MPWRERRNFSSLAVDVDRVQWVSAASCAASFDDARKEIASSLERDLSAAPQLVCLFLSPEHAAGYVRVVTWLRRSYPGARIFGGIVPGVIGDGRELLPGPGIAVTAAVLPDCRLSSVRVPRLQPGSPLRLPDAIRCDSDSHWLILTDPHSMDSEALARQLDAHSRGIKVGGVCGDPMRRFPTALFLDDQVHTDGAIALAIGGAIEAELLLAQGCRPIGEPLIVMEARDNVIVRFDRGDACEVLADVMRSLDDETRELANRTLCIGLQAGEHDPASREVRYVMRGLLGVSRDPEGIAVAAVPRRHEIVQLHVAEAETAHEALEDRLRAYAARTAEPLAGLCFRSAGRTPSFYGSPDHESRVVRDLVGPATLGGCFCNGEIAPLDGLTYVHGFTSAIVTFRPR